MGGSFSPRDVAETQPKAVALLMPQEPEIEQKRSSGTCCRLVCYLSFIVVLLCLLFWRVHMGFWPGFSPKSGLKEISQQIKNNTSCCSMNADGKPVCVCPKCGEQYECSSAAACETSKCPKCDAAQAQDKQSEKLESKQASGVPADLKSELPPVTQTMPEDSESETSISALSQATQQRQGAVRAQQSAAASVTNAVTCPHCNRDLVKRTLATVSRDTMRACLQPNYVLEITCDCCNIKRPSNDPQPPLCCIDCNFDICQRCLDKHLPKSQWDGRPLRRQRLERAEAAHAQPTQHLGAK